jgi:hypothetical protein
MCNVEHKSQMLEGKIVRENVCLSYVRRMHEVWNVTRGTFVAFTSRLVRLFFFFNSYSGGCGVQTGSTRHVGHLLAYCTCPG